MMVVQVNHRTASHWTQVVIPCGAVLLICSCLLTHCYVEDIYVICLGLGK